MEKFQVPQFIETEDKVIGPFTLKQFMYLAAAGGILFLLFFYVRPAIWFVYVGILGGIAAIFAFAKYNGHSFAKIMYLLLRYYWNPRIYLWKHENVVMGKKIKIETKRVTKQEAKTSTSLQESTHANIPLPQVGKIRDLWQDLMTSKSRSAREISSVSDSAFIKAPGGGRISAKRVDY